MELASMLAEEPFSDHPRSVSPIIARFLRVYNDRIDDERRQELYPYAALVVGTRASRAVERSRARHCANWAIEAGIPLPLLTRAFPGSRAAAAVARHAALDGSEGAHRRALSLVDELISFGDSWAGVPSDARALRASRPDRAGVSRTPRRVR